MQSRFHVGLLLLAEDCSSSFMTWALPLSIRRSVRAWKLGPQPFTMAEDVGHNVGHEIFAAFCSFLQFFARPACRNLGSEAAGLPCTAEDAAPEAYELRISCRPILTSSKASTPCSIQDFDVYVRWSGLMPHLIRMCRMPS